MKNQILKIIVGVAILIGVVSLISFQPKKPREVVVKIIDADMCYQNPDKAQAYLLEMTKRGYNLKQIVSYVNGVKEHSCFLIVMER